MGNIRLSGKTLFGRGLRGETRIFKGVHAALRACQGLKQPRDLTKHPLLRSVITLLPGFGRFCQL
jgi:hypothetical protein